MALKYYVRVGYDGKPLDRFIHTFSKYPGEPYKEISIPNCCTPVVNKQIYFSTEYAGPACSGGISIYIDGVLVPINDGVTPENIFPTIEDYLVYLNEAYAGKFSFVIDAGVVIIATILLEWNTFEVTAGWTCE